MVFCFGKGEQLTLRPVLIKLPDQFVQRCFGVRQMIFATTCELFVAIDRLMLSYQDMIEKIWFLLTRPSPPQASPY